MTAPATPDDVAAAARRIEPHVRRTPVLDVEVPTPGGPRRVTLKLELLQVTGSFKVRGAFNRVLSAPEVPPVGVIAASGGNHGLAVAHVASTLGLAAEIFVPEASPAAKVDRLRAVGGRVGVTVGGALYADAQEAATRRAAESGALVVHPYDQVEVIAGQGTMSRELEEQAPDVDTILVAVGGGGLIAGAACWFEGRRRIVAVEPATSCALAAALRAGHPVDVEVSGVAADSLGARRVGDLPFAAAQVGVTACLTVSDDEIVRAQRHLWSDVRLVAEPGGATALAALLSGAYVPEPDERVAVVVCGANTDPASVATPRADG
ncbi:threonine/serine dehydratase [Actinomarinicola tropica]|uniref:threonine/serine dehydratase n=1 Tax=Actinomarinicola tropica TaxID=2789776 RepID=UPI001E529DCC|nr:threonine/serine dehydratase [Actinomarinicola tropica]